MFEIDRDENRIVPLKTRTLSELNFMERNHLQEWLAKAPVALGEELLIIQKEFAGFAETKERLDLLALDKEGRLVIIENKRDDTGKDVVWQALKYVAFCSTLTKSEIVDIFQKYLEVQTRPDNALNAGELICKFLNADSIEEVDLNSGSSQRVILVATTFPKEVTSTVLWLIDNGIDARCMKVTPYEVGDKLLLDVTQIIPPPEAEDYMIGMASKGREEKETITKRKKLSKLRRKFWEHVLEHMNQHKFELYQDVKPWSYKYLTAKSGIDGCVYAVGIKEELVWVGFCLWYSNTDMHKKIYDLLRGHGNKIHTKFGDELDWEGPYYSNELYDITYYEEFDSYNEENWPEMTEWLFEHIQKIEKAFKPIIPEIKKQISVTSPTAE